jgi:hypothetical protein
MLQVILLTGAFECLPYRSVALPCLLPSTALPCIPSAAVAVVVDTFPCFPYDSIQCFPSAAFAVDVAAVIFREKSVSEAVSVEQCKRSSGAV